MRQTRVVIVLCLLAATLQSACDKGGEVGPDAGGLCADGLDNDGDDLIDYPADPGCDDYADNDESNNPIAQCGDGRDNDADGLVDYPDDPGCFSPLQDDEVDDCPGGVMCPACSNTLDDDGDGLIDYPNDDGCSAASDTDEFVTNPAACGATITAMRLTEPGATGVLMPGGASDLSSPTCGGSGDETAFELVLTTPRVLVATTDRPQNMVDTVLYLRSTCTDPATEITCSDDYSGAMFNAGASRIVASLDAGVYYLVVDSADALGGQFSVEVALYNGEGTACADTDQCGPGLVCRVPGGGTEMVCSQPVCSDGYDDDGDGKTDYPVDPGCANPADATEDDNCPSGGGCPKCANGIDDDGDGLIDYPADTGCSSAGQPIEGCGMESDSMEMMTGSSVSGDTSTATGNWTLTCGSSGTAPDRVHLVDLPAMQSFHADLAGTSFDSVIAVYPQACGTSLGCSDVGGNGNDQVNLTNLAANLYAIVVDGYFGASGPYTLNISGVIAPGGRCDGVLAQAGAIACGTNYTCQSGTCVGSSQCNNGIDDDGDGYSGYPTDPGCTSPDDDDETDDCPSGPTCPACANELDDDGDLFTDYPTDTSCTSASSTSESCVSSEPVVAITMPSTMGTTVGQTGDIDTSCGGGSGADVIYQIDLPATTSFAATIEPNTWDATLSLLPASCSGTALYCADEPETLNTTNLAAGRYYVVVDGYFSTSAGAYTLAVSGRIGNGASCESPLVGSGVLSCNDGYACKGSAGSKTCQLAQCSDGVNNSDGDTKIDYPADPGCTSPSDDSEADTCPGAGCPVCADGSDNDGDGLTDYPMDFGCPAASGTTEVACSPSTDAVALITNATTGGTTTGKTNDFTPPTACVSSSNAPDVSYILNLPVTVTTLTIDTIGAPFDTVLTFDDPLCATPVLQCDNNGGGSLTSKITRMNVPAGAYAVTVDGSGTAAGAYSLHVKGTVPAGSTCTSPLFAAGVLECPVGQNCTAGTCQ